MNYEVRPINDDEVMAFRQAVSLGFGGDQSPLDEPRFRQLMPLDRTLAALDGDEVVGTFGDFPLQLTVPGGGQVPMAGTTMVTVRPTHRRQGILSAMMRQHLDLVVERGDALAGLWASETGIYGRFGYGIATELHDLRVNSHNVSLPSIPGVSTHLVSSSDLKTIVAPFWDAAITQRAGFIGRDDIRWDTLADDLEHRREGGSSRRHVVARRGDDVIGHLSFRQKSKWNEAVPEGTLEIEDFMAEDVEGRRALWQFITNVDLFPNVHQWNAPIDDVIALDTNDLRSVRRLVHDALYVRILNVEAALGARSYEGDGSFVIRVVDDLGYADGTFSVDVSNGVATVEPSDSSPTITLDVRELGSLYLGGVSAVGLQQAERIAGGDHDVLQLDRTFRTATAPWCSEEF